MSAHDELVEIIRRLQHGESTRQMLIERADPAIDAFLDEKGLSGDGKEFQRHLVAHFRQPFRFVPDHIASEIAAKIPKKWRKPVDDRHRWYWLVGMAILAFLGYYYYNLRSRKSVRVASRAHDEPTITPKGPEILLASIQKRKMKRTPEEGGRLRPDEAIELLNAVARYGVFDEAHADQIEQQLERRDPADDAEGNGYFLVRLAVRPVLGLGKEQTIVGLADAIRRHSPEILVDKIVAIRDRSVEELRTV